MTDKLVKKLRYLGDHASYEPHMYHVAADRILTMQWAISVMFFAAAAEMVIICLLMNKLP